jgi:hypothetical protein
MRKPAVRIRAPAPVISRISGVFGISPKTLFSLFLYFLTKKGRQMRPVFLIKKAQEKTGT